MTDLRIGITDYPYDRERYRNDFPIVELRVGHTSPPGGRSLRRWAREAGEDFQHIWVAWRAFTHTARDIKGGRTAPLLEGEDATRRGHFYDTAENRRVWDLVKDAAQDAGATMILLETPASFSPSPANKNLMRAFVEGWAALPDEVRLAWQPAGFWDREECITFAEELGLILAVDPLVDLQEPLPSGPLAYFRMLGAHGIGGRYGDEALEQLAELAEDFEEAIVIFRTRSAIDDAKRFSDIARDLIG